MLSLHMRMACDLESRAMIYVSHYGEIFTTAKLAALASRYRWKSSV